MADIDNIGTAYGSGSLANVPPLSFYQERIIDFSDTGLAMAASDTMQVFDVPAYVNILGGKIDVITADSAATTIDMGITGGDVDLLIDGIAANSTGSQKSGDAVTPEAVVAAGGEMGTADWVVSILALTNGLSDGVIRCQIWGVDLRGRQADPA